MRKLLSVLGDSFFSAICVVGIAYNVLVAVNSSDGIRMKEILDGKIAVEKARLSALKNEYAFLNARTDRLLSSSLDHDLLEERVRSVLGLVDRREYMVRVEDLDRIARLNPVADDAPQGDPDMAPKADEPVSYAALGLVAR